MIHDCLDGCSGTVQESGDLRHNEAPCAVVRGASQSSACGVSGLDSRFRVGDLLRILFTIVIERKNIQSGASAKLDS